MGNLASLAVLVGLIVVVFDFVLFEFAGGSIVESGPDFVDHPICVDSTLIPLSPTIKPFSNDDDVEGLITSYLVGTIRLSGWKGHKNTFSNCVMRPPPQSPTATTPPMPPPDAIKFVVANADDLMSDVGINIEMVDSDASAVPFIIVPLVANSTIRISRCRFQSLQFDSISSSTDAFSQNYWLNITITDSAFDISDGKQSVTDLSPWLFPSSPLTDFRIASTLFFDRAYPVAAIDFYSHSSTTGLIFNSDANKIAKVEFLIEGNNFSIAIRDPIPFVSDEDRLRYQFVGYDGGVMASPFIVHAPDLFVESPSYDDTNSHKACRAIAFPRVSKSAAHSSSSSSSMAVSSGQQLHTRISQNTIQLDGYAQIIFLRCSSNQGVWEFTNNNATHQLFANVRYRVVAPEMSGFPKMLRTGIFIKTVLDDTASDEGDFNTKNDFGVIVMHIADNRFVNIFAPLFTIVDRSLQLHFVRNVVKTIQKDQFGDREGVDGNDAVLPVMIPDENNLIVFVEWRYKGIAPIPPCEISIEDNKLHNKVGITRQRKRLMAEDTPTTNLQIGGAGLIFKETHTNGGIPQRIYVVRNVISHVAPPVLALGAEPMGEPALIAPFFFDLRDWAMMDSVETTATYVFKDNNVHQTREGKITPLTSSPQSVTERFICLAFAAKGLYDQIRFPKRWTFEGNSFHQYALNDGDSLLDQMKLNPDWFENYKYYVTNEAFNVIAPSAPGAPTPIPSTPALIKPREVQTLSIGENITLANESSPYNHALFVAGLACTLIFAVLLLSSLIFCCCHRVAVSRRMAAYKETLHDLTRMQRKKVKMLIRLRVLKDAKEKGQRRNDRISTCLFLAALCALIGAGLLFVLSLTDHRFNSNFSVVYEEFASQDDCEFASSASGRMPSVLHVIDPSFDCQQMSDGYVEFSRGTMFALATCENDEHSADVKKVRVKMSGSSHTCHQSSVIELKSGECYPFGFYTVNGDYIDNGGGDSIIAPRGTSSKAVNSMSYVRLTCSTAEQVKQYEKDMIKGMMEQGSGMFESRGPNDRTIIANLNLFSSSSLNVTRLESMRKFGNNSVVIQSVPSTLERIEIPYYWGVESKYIWPFLQRVKLDGEGVEYSDDEDDPKFPMINGSSVKISTSFTEHTLASEAAWVDFDLNRERARIAGFSPLCQFRTAVDEEMVAYGLYKGYDFMKFSPRPKETNFDFFSNCLTYDADFDFDVTMPLFEPFFKLIGNDRPVGRVYGYYGDVDREVSWAGPVTTVVASPLRRVHDNTTAAITASRFYGAKDSRYDIAQYLPTSDEEGYTVNAFVRASRRTLGFVYAVTDAFENVETAQVYTLEKLAAQIDKGITGEGSWIDADYAVYQALYADGAANTLTFAMADQGQGVSAVIFELDKLGVMFLFNDMYHAITIIISNGAGEIRARLYIDGETGDGIGWSQCITHDVKPIPMRPAPVIGDDAPAYDSETDKVTEGGMVVVGYLNAAVHRLMILDRLVSKDDMLDVISPDIRSVASVIRNENSADSDIPLTAACFVISWIFLLLTCVTSCVSIRGYAKHTSVSNYRAVATSFYSEMEKALTAETLFGKENFNNEKSEAAMNAAASAAATGTTAVNVSSTTPNTSTTNASSSSSNNNSNSAKSTSSTANATQQQQQQAPPSVTPWTGIRPIPFQLALRWAGMTQDELLLTIENINDIYHDDEQKAIETIVDLLFQKRFEQKEKKDKNKNAVRKDPPFDIAQWNAFLAEDMQKEEDSGSGSCCSCCCCSKAIRVRQKDTELCGGVDIFLNFFGPCGLALTRYRESHKTSAALPQSPHIFVALGQFTDDQHEDLLHDAAGADGAGEEEFSENRQGVVEGAVSVLDNLQKTRSMAAGVAKSAGKGAAGAYNQAAATNAIGEGGGKSVASTVEDQAPSQTKEVATAPINQSNKMVTEQVEPALQAAQAAVTHSAIRVGEFIYPIITAFQTLDVWMTAFQMPETYISAFKKLFSFFAIDFAVTFPELPTIVVPILQVIAGLVVVCAAIFFMVEDDRIFEACLTRYVWRRDLIAKERYGKKGGGNEASTTSGSGSSVGGSSTSTNSPANSPMASLMSSNGGGSSMSSSTASPPQTSTSSASTSPPSNNTGTNAPQLDLMVSTDRNDIVGLSVYESERQYNLCGGKSDVAFIDAEAPIVPPELLETLKENDYAEIGGDECVVLLPRKYAKQIDLFTGDLDRDIQKDKSVSEQKKMANNVMKSEFIVVGVERDDDQSDTNSVSSQQSNTKSTEEEEENAAGGRKWHTFKLKKDQVGLKILWFPKMFLYRILTIIAVDGSDPPPQPKDPSDKKDDGTLKATDVSMYCPLHPKRMLTPLSQTDVWPYFHRPSCCVATEGGDDGECCGAQTGDIFSCREVMEGTIEETILDPKTGEEKKVVKVTRKTLCTFAVCEDHLRPSLFDFILNVMWTKLRLFLENGFMWAACVIAFVAINAAYIPLMKTALMIIACHPFYHCEFKHCWADADQKFAIAAYFSIVIIVFLGAGFPLALFFSLRSRKARIRAFTVSGSYKNLYTAPTPRGCCCTCSCNCLCQAILPSEFARFTMSEKSALAEQYQSLEPKWMYYPAIGIFLKLLTLLPAVFLESDAFAQKVASVGVQFFLTLSTFIFNFYLSPILTMVLRVTEAHNLMILDMTIVHGILKQRAIDGEEVIDRSDIVRFNPYTTLLRFGGSFTADEWELFMISITFFYIVFCAIVYIVTTGKPKVDSYLANKRAVDLLAPFGLDYAKGFSWYLDPLAPKPKIAKLNDDGEIVRGDVEKGEEETIVNVKTFGQGTDCDDKDSQKNDTQSDDDASNTSNSVPLLKKEDEDSDSEVEDDSNTTTNNNGGGPNKNQLLALMLIKSRLKNNLRAMRVNKTRKEEERDKSQLKPSPSANMTNASGDKAPNNSNHNNTSSHKSASTTHTSIAIPLSSPPRPISSRSVSINNDSNGSAGTSNACHSSSSIVQIPLLPPPSAAPTNSRDKNITCTNRIRSRRRKGGVGLMSVDDSDGNLGDGRDDNDAIEMQPTITVDEKVLTITTTPNRHEQQGQQQQRQQAPLPQQSSNSFKAPPKRKAVLFEDI